jgi:hypothetical protein
MRTRVLLITVVAGVLALEAWAVMVDRDGTFAIEGEIPRVMGQFGEGQPFRQAFLMQGAGLHQVRVVVSSPRRERLPLDWSLWRGTPDEPSTFTTAFQSRQELPLSAGRQWITLSFPRDGNSNDRWYTIEIKSVDPAASAGVAIHASDDNPERGGVLWVNNVRQPGSLRIRADRLGRTLFRRFEIEGLPHLPAIFANPVFQWLVVIAVHWAFAVVIWTLVKDGWLDVNGGRDS